MGCNSLRREIFWGFTYNPGNSRALCPSAVVPQADEES